MVMEIHRDRWRRASSSMPSTSSPSTTRRGSQTGKAYWEHREVPGPPRLTVASRTALAKASTFPGGPLRPHLYWRCTLNPVIPSRSSRPSSMSSVSSSSAIGVPLKRRTARSPGRGSSRWWSSRRSTASSRRSCSARSNASAARRRSSGVSAGAARASNAAAALEGDDRRADRAGPRSRSPTRTCSSRPGSRSPAATRCSRATRTSCPGPGYTPNGEERAWGRRLAKRFGCDAHYDDRAFRSRSKRPQAPCVPVLDAERGQGHRWREGRAAGRRRSTRPGARR